MQGEETEDDWEASLEDEMAKNVYVCIYVCFLFLFSCMNLCMYEGSNSNK